MGITYDAILAKFSKRQNIFNTTQNPGKKSQYVTSILGPSQNFSRLNIFFRFRSALTNIV